MVVVASVVVPVTTNAFVIVAFVPVALPNISDDIFANSAANIFAKKFVLVAAVIDALVIVVVARVVVPYTKASLFTINPVVDAEALSTPFASVSTLGSTTLITPAIAACALQL